MYNKLNRERSSIFKKSYMTNTKIIAGVLAAALILAFAGIYLGVSNLIKIGDIATSLAKRIDADTQRLSKRTSPNVYVGEPVGYVITFENGARFYISGDTAPSADMKLVIGDYYKPDVAVLSAGGLFTMGPKEAAFAAYLIRPKKYVIPYHYGSYPMLMQDPQEFFKALEPYNLAAQPLAFEVGKEKEVMGVKMTWLGHASWLLVSPEGRKILIDPARLLGLFPERYKNFSNFEKMDLILLTHGHPDHVVISDLNELTKLYKPVIFAPYDLGAWLKEHAANPDAVFNLLNKGGSVSQDDFLKVGLPAEKIGSIRIDLVSANHSASGSIQ
jgi:L-ascorbate metabolism protein UlaG (beta-lactamase superfamily)